MLFTRVVPARSLGRVAKRNVRVARSSSTTSAKRDINQLFAENPILGVGAVACVAGPFAYMTLMKDQRVYIGEAPQAKPDGVEKSERSFEKERVSLYAHLIDDPVASRRKEMSLMTDDQKQKMILGHAMMVGMNSAITAGILTGAGVMGLVQMSATFRKYTGVSGRIAPVVIAVCGSFMLANELQISEATKVGTDSFVEGLLSKSAAGNTQLSEGDGLDLTYPERLANWVFDYPFKTLTLLSVPMVSGIFYYQHKNPAYASLKFSQKIMHTRVYGQAYVVAMLALVMGFRDYMDRNGRFVPKQIAELQSAASNQDE